MLINSSLYSVTSSTVTAVIVRVLSPVSMYNDYADERVYSVTVIFHVDIEKLQVLFVILS